jgi:multidrug efflux system outer membrane protein
MRSDVKRSLGIILAATTVLAGCDFAPKYVRPVGAIPADLPQGGIYPPAASDAPDVTKIGWRDFFTDERLRQVIASGIENNRDLRIAAANVLAARAQYRIQRSEQLPTINATGAADFQHADGKSFKTYTVDAGFSAFEIDLFGRLKNLSKAALEQYFATEEAQRSTRIALIAEIANAWLTLGADRDQLVIARETMDSNLQTRDLTQAQFRIGTTSEVEARQADAQYQSARNDVAVLETQVAQDRNALEVLVGAPVPDALLPTTLPANGATLNTLPAGISSDVLLQRPDVLQAEHRLISENANIGAARAAMFPTISLTGLLGLASGGLSGLFSGGAFTRTIEPAVSYDIFNAGRSRANVHLAEANQQAALANYEKTLQTAFREVADALAQRGTIDEQLSATTAGSESATVAARLSNARYRVGVGSFLDYLVNQRAAYVGQQQLVTTRLDRELNLVELYRALGGGLS